jgi:hypothetical protein
MRKFAQSFDPSMMPDPSMMSGLDDPSMSGDPSMGLGSLPDMSGMGAEPEPQEETPTPPLSTLMGVLKDYGIEDVIKNDTGKPADELGMEIWVSYGGNDLGGADKGKIGKRPLAGISPELSEKEMKETINTKWERLEEGKTIAEITSLEDLVNTIQGLIYGLHKPAPSPMGGFASLDRLRMVLAAQEADYEGYGSFADALDYSSRLEI